jgi:hypothetical protein
VRIARAPRAPQDGGTPQENPAVRTSHGARRARGVALADRHCPRPGGPTRVAHRRAAAATPATTRMFAHGRPLPRARRALPPCRSGQSKREALLYTAPSPLLRGSAVPVLSRSELVRPPAARTLVGTISACVVRLGRAHGRPPRLAFSRTTRPDANVFEGPTLCGSGNCAAPYQVACQDQSGGSTARPRPVQPGVATYSPPRSTCMPGAPHAARVRSLRRGRVPGKRGG